MNFEMRLALPKFWFYRFLCNGNKHTKEKRKKSKQTSAAAGRGSSFVMSIFAQAFPVGGGAEAEEEEESSVFGAAPVRMRLNKPAANRFILGAVRHAQGAALLFDYYY
jgi:hypothetical protein